MFNYDALLSIKALFKKISKALFKKAKLKTLLNVATTPHR